MRQLKGAVNTDGATISIDLWNKIYKCTLHPNEQSIVSIGKEWTNDITNQV